MRKYDSDDIATFYFVIAKGDRDEKYIKAWTDERMLFDAYVDFHRSNLYEIKKITKSVRDLYQIVNENFYDEIKVGNLIVKKKYGYGMVAVPITDAEMQFISEETNSVLATRIDYALINNYLPLFKGRYRNALKNIFLEAVIDQVVHNNFNKSMADVQIDQLALFYRSFPEHFGE